MDQYQANRWEDDNTMPQPAAHRDRSLRVAHLVTSLVAILAALGCVLSAQLLKVADPARAAVEPGSPPAVTGPATAPVDPATGARAGAAPSGR